MANAIRDLLVYPFFVSRIGLSVNEAARLRCSTSSSRDGIPLSTFVVAQRMHLLPRGLGSLSLPRHLGKLRTLWDGDALFRCFHTFGFFAHIQDRSAN